MFKLIVILHNIDVFKVRVCFRVMATIGMRKIEGRYFPLYKFSRDSDLVTPRPFSTFEAGLVFLLGECNREVTSGALREPLTDWEYEGLTPDQCSVMGGIISLYNEIVGRFPRA